MSYGTVSSRLFQSGNGLRSGNISGGPEGAENPWIRERCLRALFLYCGPDASGKRCPQRSLAVPVPSTNTFWNGNAKEYLYVFGAKDWQSMMRWRGLLGHGKASMGRWSKPPWPWRPLERIQRTGEKNGTKRSLLVDGNGIPLSLVVSGANRHDVALLESTLDQIVIERLLGKDGPKEHLCADKGYAGQPAQESILRRNYIPHVKQRGEEVEAKKRNPRYRARRWVVERTHSWLNRFRKLLVRFEKTVESYEGLLELACAMIAFRQVIVIYG